MSAPTPGPWTDGRDVPGESIIPAGTKHTPGPWTMDGDGLPHRAVRAYGGTSNVALVYGLVIRFEDPERDANARLIAAAPEMYEALQSLLDLMYAHPVHGWCIGPRAQSEVDAARAALAKAVQP